MQFRVNLMDDATQCTGNTKCAGYHVQLIKPSYKYGFRLVGYLKKKKNEHALSSSNVTTITQQTM